MNAYGKNNIINIISSMIKNNRLAHSFLIYGDKGLGKKFLAKYISMLILCNDKTDGIPCGKCRSCHNIIKNIHSDVISVPHSGKLNGFSVETIRNICREASVFPNDGDKKIYIIDDADAISISAQNILLKTIEEPPEFAYFIFTASSKNVFLDTIISRVISLGVSECTAEECRMALAELQFDENDINSAISAFSGNIGNCIAYINDESFRQIAELTKLLTDCIINNDEYGFLTAISKAETDKRTLRQVIYMLDLQIRDSMILKFNDNSLSGCYHEGAKKLSEKMALSKGEKIHSLLNETIECINSNVNVKLITASLCRNIADC